MLSPEALERVLSAETSAFPSPIPTQCRSGDCASSRRRIRKTDRRLGPDRSSLAYGHIAKPAA